MNYGPCKMLPKARLAGSEVKAEIPPGLSLADSGAFAKVPKMKGGGKQSAVVRSAMREAGRADLSVVYRLAYVSEASPCFGADDLRDIKEKSTVRNAELDITGILVMDEGRILQILEGEEKAVMDLFATIAVDSRHQAVRQVSGGKQGKRYLNCWSLVSGQDSSTPVALKEDFHKLHARLSAREGMEDILPQEVELLKVVALFRSLPS